MISIIIIGVLLFIVGALAVKVNDLSKARANALKKSIDNNTLTEELRTAHEKLVEREEQLGAEREKNRTLLSQKKSSETRLGQISEHLIPFLNGCTHDPKNLHFMGNPIDYLAFDFDDGKITFLEVKSGNSKASKRQKIIKNIIKTGRVFYEELRINEKGIKSRVTGLDGQE